MLTNERKSQIAMLVAKNVLIGTNRKLSDLKRDLGNEARHIGVPAEELNEFASFLLKEFADDLATGQKPAEDRD